MLPELTCGAGAGKSSGGALRRLRGALIERTDGHAGGAEDIPLPPNLERLVREIRMWIEHRQTQDLRPEL
jgi:hypothetical protein